jgi:hypothetical protein
LFFDALVIAFVHKSAYRAGDKTREFFMYCFEASVRVGTQLVKTRVQAANAFDAKLLLQAQYGAANIVGFVQQVR